MKLIDCSTERYPGTFSKVDDDDFDLVSKYRWFAKRDYKKYYAYAWMRGKQVPLHRFILNPNKSMVVDHINGDGLDNSRSNLRMVTSSQNQMNRGPQRNCSSGFKGVSFSSKSQKWTSRIEVMGRKISLGCFENKESAALAYNMAAVKHHGEFAYQNEIPPPPSAPQAQPEAKKEGEA